MLFHRVAHSELYRAPVQAVRAMPFRDFHVAHLILDHADAIRDELEPGEDDGS